MILFQIAPLLSSICWTGDPIWLTGYQNPRINLLNKTCFEGTSSFKTVSSSSHNTCGQPGLTRHTQNFKRTAHKDPFVHLPAYQFHLWHSLQQI